MLKYTPGLTTLIYIISILGASTVYAQNIDKINDDELQKLEQKHAEIQSTKKSSKDTPKFDTKITTKLEKTILNHCENANQKNIDNYMADFVDDIKNSPEHKAYAKRAMELKELTLICDNFQVQELFPASALVHYRQISAYKIGNEKYIDNIILSLRLKKENDNWKIYYSERKPFTETEQ